MLSTEMLCNIYCEVLSVCDCAAFLTKQTNIGWLIDTSLFSLPRFMFILMIIGTAFLCGINNIYVPYVTQPYLGR